MNKAQKELNDIQDQINSLNSEIKSKQKSIDEANKKQAEEEILLQKRIRAMYENGEVTYIKILMDSNSISDFFNSSVCFNSITSFACSNSPNWFICNN